MVAIEIPKVIAAEIICCKAARALVQQPAHLDNLITAMLVRQKGQVDHFLAVYRIGKYIMVTVHRKPRSKNTEDAGVGGRLKKVSHPPDVNIKHAC